MHIKTILCFPLFFVLTSTIHADVSVSEIITAEKMYDLHFTDAQEILW
jgi:hypothetical protein